MCPRQVRCKLNGAVIIVAIGCTDAHGFDFLNATHLVDDYLQCFHTGVYIVFYLLVATGLDGCGGFDVTTGIDNTKNGVCTSQIQADDIRLHYIL